MLAGDAATEVDHDIGDGVGDALHPLDPRIGFSVDERADVEHSGPRMGVEGRERVVRLEHLLEPPGVLGEVFGGHRTVLDERDVFGVGGPGKQDGHPRLPHLPEPLSGRVVVGLHCLRRPDRHVASLAVIGWISSGITAGPAVREQVCDRLPALIVAVGVELNEQYCVGPLGEYPDDVCELLRVPSEVEQNVVHHLDRRRAVFERRFHVSHRVQQVVVRQQRDGFGLRDGFERDGRLGDDGERSFTPREQACEVDAGVIVDFPVDGRFLDEHIQVVARDVALHLRVALAHLVGVAVEDIDNASCDAGLGVAVRVGLFAQVANASLAELGHCAVGEHNLTGFDIGVCFAVLQRV